MVSPEEKPKHDRFPVGKTYGLMAVVPVKSEATKITTEEQVQTWPAAISRELLLFIVTLLALCTLALLFNAPLEEPANALHPPNPAKAPWYFLGLQELVSYSAFWGGVGIPGLLVALAMIAPYLERKPGGEGVWFHPSRTAANWTFLTILGTLAVLTVIGTFFRGENWALVMPF